MLDAAEAVISTAARVAASLLAFTLWLPVVPAHAQVGSILQVTTTADVVADDGACSLREAIIASNTNTNADGTVLSCAGTGVDSIRFSIGSGNPQINITTPLPVITAPVAIRGNTGGATRVVLSGPGGAPDATQPGLTVASNAPGTSIRSLVINNFRGYGIRIEASNVTVANCYIGTNATGTAILPNLNSGIYVLGASAIIGGVAGVTPGGACTGDCNVISGNSGYGINLAASSALVQGNFIGVNAAGTGALGNAFGVRVGNVTTGVTIGGATAQARNVISGNAAPIPGGGTGIELSGSNHSVLGNYIGTNTSGTAAIANLATGVQLYFSTAATIGGGAPGEGNVISGNTVDGVNLISSAMTTVRGNFIGTAADGLAPLGNGEDGIHAVAESLAYLDNVVGGTAAGEANVIAFNGGSGVRIEGQLAVRANSIHDNAGAGIVSPSLAAAQPPVLTAAGFPLEGSACASCRVDIYSDESDEGRIYEGTAVADGAGLWGFDGQLAGPNITTTATQGTGAQLTSVFSAPIACEDFDGDDVCDSADDSDFDGIIDALDNCILAPNGPLLPDAGGGSQRDADNDGYGNLCDADLNNSLLTTAVDFNLLRTVLNQSAGASSLAAAADLNGSGLVSVLDYNVLRTLLNQPPGPSALSPDD